MQRDPQCDPATFSTLGYIYKEGGVKALYRGVRSVLPPKCKLNALSVCLTEVFPAHALVSVFGKQYVRSNS